jgi:hypothetical protein
MNTNVRLIDPVQDRRWDRFVESHPFGWICHLAAWKAVLERSFPQMKAYYLALFDTSGENIIAGLPIYQVKSWITGNRLVSIPFATICDPLVSTSHQATDLLDAALGLFYGRNNSVMEVRALQATHLIEDNRVEKVSFYKTHFLNLEQPLDHIRSRIVDRCVRRSISKALKSQLEIRLAETVDDLKVFYNLHKKTRRRLGLPCQPYGFIDNLWRNFHNKEQMHLLIAMDRNNSCAALIVFSFGNRVSAEFLATDDHYLNSGVNHLLYWSAIAMAQEKGATVFDFGRTSPRNPGLMSFKGRWGTDLADLSQFYYPKTRAKRLYEEETLRYKAVRILCRRTPLGMQHLIGGLLYRHLG